MKTRNRSQLAIGLFLILIGAVYLAAQFMPDLQDLISGPNTWPLVVVAVGALLLLLAVLTGEAGLAVPASIVGGIGAILYWQNLTDGWGSWAYAWALIPGFAGVGTLLSWLLGNRSGHTLDAGIGMIFTSIILFLIFGSFMGGFTALGPWWPALLVLAGLLLILRSILSR